MHDRIIAACEAGNADLAGTLAEQNWANLAVLLQEKS